MTPEEAHAGLDAMEMESRMRDRAGAHYAILTAIPSMLMGGAGLGYWPKRNLGYARGQQRKPKNTDNSIDRAKGMKPFVINGVTIYAGTPKAARKKARLLVALSKP